MAHDPSPGRLVENHWFKLLQALGHDPSPGRLVENHWFKLLQALGGRCSECAIHHERDVRKE